MKTLVSARSTRLRQYIFYSAFLLPIALTTKAHAVVVNPTPLPFAQITTATSTNAGLTDFTYTVSYNKPTQTSSSGQMSFTLDYFEIPLFNAGDLVPLVIAAGWTVTPETTSSNGFTGFKTPDNRAGSYLRVATTAGNGVSEGNPLTFTFSTQLTGSINVNFGVGTDQRSTDSATGQSSSSTDQIGYVDPLIPMAGPSASSVPEPASMLVLGAGLLAVGALRSRRDA